MLAPSSSPTPSPRPGSLENLTGFVRTTGSMSPDAAASLRETGFRTVDVPHASLHGYFVDDYHHGIWDAHPIQYFDRIVSGSRINPKVRTHGTTALDSSGHPVDAFDGPTFHKTVEAQSPDAQTAYIMYFGKEQFPSLYISLRPSRRVEIEQVHAVAARRYQELEGDGDPDPANGAREAARRALAASGVLYVVGAT